MAARVEDAGALLHVPDPSGRWASVSLWYHLRRPYPSRRFVRSADGWSYWLDRPTVDRLEYLLERTDTAGTTTMGLDDTNPRRVSGVFGEHSVLEFPGYRPPVWLGWPAPEGVRVDRASAQIWSPAGLGASDPAPLLLVHDGAEMDHFAQITRYSASMVEADVLPPHRVGLLRPTDRDAWYSASPAYARSLVQQTVPDLLAAVPTRGRPVLLGASLGALAALHAEWTYPGTFAGLFLASGSFFQMRFDSHEQGFGRFFRITSTVQKILDAPVTATRAPVSMACGTGEENWENNVALAAALARAGATVSLRGFRDGHTWIGWRDALHPALTDLLRSLWTPAGGH